MQCFNRFLLVLVITFIAFTSVSEVYSSETKQHKIKLVLQITVDGLRADLVDRYSERFGEGGFNYLYESGVVYKNAHYQHANTETIVGHTTLATGTFPAIHGMTGNVWLHKESGELGYNIEDPKFLPLKSRNEQREGDQVDPAQKLARTKGRSPRAILVETFSDRLKVYYGGKSKVFAISGKDRGAVPMAGQVGKAFWMSTDNGDMVTSSYYYDVYPNWVVEWNDKRQVEKFGGQQWELLYKKSSYLLGHQDDREYEVDLKGFGRVFPHQFAESDSPVLPTQIIASPYGDQLTLDFAKALLTTENLGKDSIPDYLSISFSGVDAVNHFFGPSSLENEEMVLQLDRTLRDLFVFINETVGLDKTLIVLSADHGMAEMPEYMAEQGFPAGRLYPEDVVKAANKIGKEEFNIEEIVSFYYRPYLYLDSEKIKTAELTIKRVRSVIAPLLAQQNGIALAVSRDELYLPQATQLLKQIQNSFHPNRSGDIYVIQGLYWFNFDKGPVAAMHGSPWNYDTHVPVIFAGSGISNQIVHRLVHPIDVAPTMSAILGMTAPGAARGIALPEVFR